VTIVVLGDVMEDVVAALPGPLAHGSDTPAPIARHPGGSGANVAAWLRAAGADAVLVARMGADGTEEGPGIQRDPTLPTGTCIVLVDPAGERTMIPDAGANDALVVDDLPHGEHLHVTGYGLLREPTRPAYLRALEIARARGMTISVDPSSAAPLAAAPGFLTWVEGVDLLLPNAEEVRLLGGSDDVERAALALGREVAVTLGAGGALWTDGARVLRAPAEAVAVVDTTGAGDAFAAGLLAARAAGADPAAQLAAGCALAARAVAVRGARPGPPAASPRYD
jgi:sugar/nucleoside kinase (ribokinase family)